MLQFECAYPQVYVEKLMVTLSYSVKRWARDMEMTQ